MTLNDCPKDPAELFCQAIFDWLNDKLELGKRELAQHLLKILNQDVLPPVPGRVNQTLQKRGILIPLMYAVTQNGKEIREEHLAEFINQLNQLKKRLPRPNKETEVLQQSRKSASEESQQCIEHIKT